VQPTVRRLITEAVCDAHDYIRVEFDAQTPREGWAYWVFAVAAGNPRWYPSEALLPDGEGVYHARVYTGPERRYTVYVLNMPNEVADQVRAYLERREELSDWYKGMAQPANSYLRAEQLVLSPCGSRDGKP
jgi:hypothetical protein